MLSQGQKISIGLSAALYLGAGTLHFLKPAMYIRIVPPSLPWPRALVAVSGAAEIAGGVGLLIPRVRRPAAWGIVSLLLAVFPANVYMATSRMGGIAPALLWARLPLQGVLVWWVLWCTSERKLDRPADT